MNLSPDQLAAIKHRGTHLQIIACAGSGKTEVMARRVTALIEEGITPAAIIAFTFTERAAASLKLRIHKRIADSMGAGFLDRLGPMFVDTIIVPLPRNCDRGAVPLGLPQRPDCLLRPPPS